MKNHPLRKMINTSVLEGPPFIVSLLIAEMLFKFGSFSLECIAFLALWFVLAKAYDRFLMAMPFVPENLLRSEL